MECMRLTQRVHGVYEIDKLWWMGRACVVWVDPRGGVAYGHVGMSLYGPTRLLDTCSTSHQHVALLVVACMYCACRVHRVRTLAGYGHPTATRSLEAIKWSCATLRLVSALLAPRTHDSTQTGCMEWMRLTQTVHGVYEINT